MVTAHRDGVQWTFQQPRCELLYQTSGLKKLKEVNLPGAQSAAVLVLRRYSMLDEAISLSRKRIPPPSNIPYSARPNSKKWENASGRAKI